MNEENEKQASEVFYAAGYIRHFLDNFSRSCTLSADQLASRVAALLLSQTGGEVLGPEHSVSTLRRKSPKRNSPTRKMAMAGGARRKAQVSSAQKRYWAAMTPEQRRDEMNRRMKKRPKNVRASDFVAA